MSKQIKFQIVENTKDHAPVKVKDRVLRFDTWLEADNVMATLKHTKSVTILRVSV